MEQRLQLQSLLEAVIGTRAVYFQPPESHKMVYPCFVYELDNLETNHADNLPYNHNYRWQITIIDREPASPLFKKIAALSSASFVRHFTTDDLNHYVFNFYY